MRLYINIHYQTINMSDINDNSMIIFIIMIDYDGEWRSNSLRCLLTIRSVGTIFLRYWLIVITSTSCFKGVIRKSKLYYFLPTFSGTLATFSHHVALICVCGDSRLKYLHCSKPSAANNSLIKPYYACANSHTISTTHLISIHLIITITHQC